ncbi:MAG: AAA family ATPase [Phycisphaerae bacterium]|nr:AAA family ATPase [Phycisphaerae bacterium]
MLAEKYRPRTFDQIIGQERAIRTLKWHLDTETPTGKVFLIFGPSGSGKTTLTECAARYWGVDDWDIRLVQSAECDVESLRQLDSESYVYGLGQGGRKCYVIDEIHTVTGRAHDRLLSLLEHLPKHVMVCGTTTELDWSDGTMRSRFAKVYTSKIRAEDVARYLEMVAANERLPIPEDPKWAEKLVKYNGLNIRDHLNELPDRLLAGMAA